MFHSIKTKILAAFLAAIVAVMAVAAFASFQITHANEHKATDYMGHSAAESCASVLELAAINGDDLSPDSEDYEHYREILRTLCKESEMDYLYGYRCSPDDKSVEYIVFVAADDQDEKTQSPKRSYGTVVEDDLTDIEKRVLAGEDVLQAEEYDNELGHMLDWVVRVDGWDGRVLAGASYSVTAQRNRVFWSTINVIVPSLIALVILLIVQLVVLKRRVFEPLHVISRRMRTFSAEHAGEFKPLGIESKDEMGEIAEAFEGMVADIADYTADIERMTAERVQVDVEMDVARRIQLGMVPEGAQLEGSGFDVIALARTAREVGGDFYDCFEVDDTRIAVVVGDVSGKGVAGALFMAMAKTMVHDGLAEGLGPAAVLGHVNQRLCESNPEGMFVTVFAIVYDSVRAEVRYANAGHMPPFVVGNGVCELDVDPGTLLGLFDDADLVEGTVRLAPGENVLIYTDGLTEAVNKDNEFFGKERLAACLRAAAPDVASSALVDEVVHALDSFAEGREQFDDLTLVVLARHADNLTEVAVEIASVAEMRKAILALDYDEELKRKACLACEEAFANIVMYSNASHAWYGVSVDNRDDGNGSCCPSLHMTLADDGVAFDMTTSPSVEKEFENLDSGGMGISLVRNLATDLAYRREGNRNILEIWM